MKHKKIFRDYWLKFYHNDSTGLCSLCGNTGIIDTTKTAIGPVGQTGSGRKNYCFCPNGRTMRGE